MAGPQEEITPTSSDTHHEQHHHPPIDMVVLISNDGEEYKVPSNVAKLSKFLEDTIQCQDESENDNDVGEDDDVEHTLDAASGSRFRIQTIPLPTIRSACLSKIVEFCKFHVTIEPLHAIPSPLVGCTIEENISQHWYREFVEKLELSMVYELVTAANYMDIKPLLDLSCLVVMVNLYGKSVEQIRVALNVPEMTADEKRRARVEHRWIFGD